MTSWSDGYVSDTLYQGGIYREQVPTHLDAACLVAGAQTAVQAGEPFTYCELGCGLGDTAMVVAAAHGNARVWGFDFNPSHIARARNVAARTGLDNITFAERSFEELATSASDDLPPLDYVTLHGVWSWVSVANRAHIVAFLRRYLRTGGIVSLSYNAMPGWGPKLPLQHLLFEAGRAVAGSSERRIREAIGLARRVAGTDGSAIDPKVVESVEKLLAEGRTAYLTHEYLNEHWAPSYFAEVRTALAPAKLSYVGSANILENFPQLCVTPEQHAVIEALPPELHQTVQDYFCPRAFRRDLFVRGPQALSQRGWSARLLAQRLMLLVPSAETDRQIEIPIGKATLNEPFYGPALAALGRGPASVEDLLNAAAPDTAPVPQEIIGMLIGGKQAISVPLAPDADAVARVRRFNRTRVEIIIEDGQQEGWLVGAAIGAALRVNLFGMLVYLVLSGPDEPDGAMPPGRLREAFEALLAERSLSLRPKTPSVTPDLDGELAEIVADHVPIWRQAGAL